MMLMPMMRVIPKLVEVHFNSFFLPTSSLGAAVVKKLDVMKPKNTYFSNIAIPASLSICLLFILPSLPKEKSKYNLIVAWYS